MRDLAFLIGRWRGKGKGFHPHSAPFEYEEDIIFENIGQPNFAYHSTSFINKVPKHRESGFIKFEDNNQVQLNLVDSLGTCRIFLGALNDFEHNAKSLVLTTDSSCSAPLYKEPHMVGSGPRTYLDMKDVLMAFRSRSSAEFYYRWRSLKLTCEVMQLWTRLEESISLSGREIEEHAFDHLISG
uniref:DUF1794 domain-containing protein n=1 Tax=Mesocestoides corti TaxID=53468 RepID=A0A5K3G3V1_MESCO